MFLSSIDFKKFFVKSIYALLINVIHSSDVLLNLVNTIEFLITAEYFIRKYLNAIYVPCISRASEVQVNVNALIFKYLFCAQFLNGIII